MFIYRRGKPNPDSQSTESPEEAVHVCILAIRYNLFLDQK